MLQALRREMARRHLLVLAVIVGLYCGGAWFLVRAILLGSLDEANHHLALPLATAAERPGARLEDLARDLGRMRLGAGEYLELLDPGGGLRARQGPPMAPPARLGAAPRAANEGDMRSLTRPLVQGGRLLGHVRAGHGLGELRRALWLLAGGLALMFAAALGFAAAVGGWLASKAVAPVEAALARERHFIRDAAHELRTPLAVLRLHADMAVGEAEGGPMAGRLEALRRLAGRMSALLDDLLTLSREEAEPAAPALLLPLAELVEEEAELLGPLARARGLRLELQLGEGRAQVRAAPERLARAVRIMLDNAIRYSPAGGAVELRLLEEGEALRLAVSNEGPALSGQERERLFERFHRAEGARALHPEGSGLGLAIARAIARAHGGELALSSPPGTRSTFSLTLPRAG